MDPNAWLVLVTLLVRVANGNDGEVRIWGNSPYISHAVCMSGIDIDKSRVVERLIGTSQQMEQPWEILEVDADCVHPDGSAG